MGGSVPAVEFRGLFNSGIERTGPYIMFELGFMVVTFLFFVILMKDTHYAFQFKSTTAEVLSIVKSLLFNVAAIALLAGAFYVSLFKIDEHLIKRSNGPVDEETFSLLVHKSQYICRARAVFYALVTTVLLMMIVMSVMYEVLLSPIGGITLLSLSVLCIRGIKSIRVVKLEMVVKEKTTKDGESGLYL
tara:strand:+ start:155 stop:721 length:567 start_codon:yes stop_codon:yes gene_type:complete